MAALPMGHPHQAGLQAANRSRRNRARGKGGHRNLQGEAGRPGEATAGSNQDAAGTDVQSGGELQEFLSFRIHTPDKYGDGERESVVPPSLRAGLGHGMIPPLWGTQRAKLGGSQLGRGKTG